VVCGSLQTRATAASDGSPSISEASAPLIMDTISVFAFLDFASASSRRVVARHCHYLGAASATLGIGVVSVTSVSWCQHAVLSSHTK